MDIYLPHTRRGVRLGNRALLLGRTFLANMSIRHHLSSAAAS